MKNLWVDRVLGHVGSRVRRIAVVVPLLAATAVAAVLVSPASPAAASLRYGELAAASSFYTLDVQGGGTANGTQVEVWYWTGNRNQRWDFPTDENESGFIYATGADKCLTTDGVPGHILYIFQCTNSPYQQWRVNYMSWDIAHRTVTFTNVATGLVMDVYNNSYAPGAKVTAWYPNGGLNQQWRLAIMS